MISDDYAALHPGDGGLLATELDDPAHQTDHHHDSNQTQTHENPHTNLLNTHSDDNDDLFDSLFLQPAKKRQETKFSVRAMQSKIKNHRAAKYLMDFDEKADVEGVTVMSVPKQELEEKRRLLGAEQREEWEMEETHHDKYLKALEAAEENSLARVRLWHEATERYKDHFERVKRLKHRQYQQNLGHTFKAATKHFKSVLRQRKKRMNKTYGDLTEFRLKKFNQFKHNLVWRNVPQKIKLYIRFIRGVKDKLPKGQYILLVTLRDRIGGRIVSIKTRGEKRRKVKNDEYTQGFFQQTMEVSHDGKFSSLEIEFEQPLFLVSPSQSQRKPYMVFTFELIQTVGPNAGLCCAWAAFPVEDSSFNIIEGKYKVPMARGWLTPNVDQYWKFHTEYTKNLDKWMGNLYFQVKPLPRERRGRVETQAHVQALKKLSDVVVQDDDLFMSESSSSSEDETETDLSDEEGNEMDNDDDVSFDDEEDFNSVTEGTDEDLNFSDKDSDEERRSDDEDGLANLARKAFEKKMKTLNGTSEADGQGSQSSASDSDDEEADEESDEDDSDFLNSDDDDDGDEVEKKKPTPLKIPSPKGDAPLSEQIGSESEASEDIANAPAVDEMPKGGLFRKQRNPAELNKYLYALPQPTGYKESVLTFRKGKYLTKAVLTDMGISSFTSIFTREFWVSAFLFILSFFIRQYMHYFGQFVLVWIFGVPSVQYYPNVLYVELDYQALYLNLFQEILVVAGGVATNTLFFAVFIIAIHLLQKLHINVPAFASKMCVMYGVATFLDPFLVLLSDVIFQRWSTGDWFKLFIYYDTSVSGEGVWGVLITILIYTYLSLVSGFLMYRFVLRIFMNGQIIDVFRRVHATEKTFFLPLDLEVSREEMEWACSKARKFRGSGGSVRRLVVMEYALTDPRDPAFFERSLHIIIYSLIPRGKNVFTRRVYRQFLQLENNAIVEIFDDNDAKSLISNQMKSLDSSNIVNNAEDDQFQGNEVDDFDEDELFDEEEDSVDLTTDADGTTNDEGSDLFEDDTDEEGHPLLA
mmetsp:Transcript_8737/g.32289  ORF Transcript_8737/g.32289 Transcript_8737/m.32289 type:complete len:1033 (-) Transcript_8737:331-3429(-)|eukprot:CAMPEP_0117446994 /NCGR_PEP_ID=MMETSP0759-20121206/6638_1 /TAXON_ID=63605 /ORGANISM="Percolomonas cosmopolitus, Strain WS" /LENGTH=1032 /DNA_ID=CAMNT_0005239299 /DNA_START=224 /DNA_END=3322 /DNA_ORIENTATION=-